MGNFKEGFYQRTYQYAFDVLRFLKTLQKDSAVHVLENQLIRSATSVAANILEAKAASSKRDYINFYTHALKSANESTLWLNLIRDCLQLKSNECERLLQETIEIGKILGASILTMKGQRKIKS